MRMRSLVLFLTPIRMGLFILFLARFAWSAASSDKEIQENKMSIDDSIDDCSNLELSKILDIPKKCPCYQTKECLYGHNGMCRYHPYVDDCDYTVDACRKKPVDNIDVKPVHNWYCTCCAFCDGKYAKNECKTNGGNCRVNCQKDEVSAKWQCSSNRCRCCKKDCAKEQCASGKGFCVSKSSECPEGHFISKMDKCEGSGCSCCKPCSFSSHCMKAGGFCEGYGRPCPKGFVDDQRCPCKDKECRCCKRYSSIDGFPIYKCQNKELEVDIPQNL